MRILAAAFVMSPILALAAQSPAGRWTGKIHADVPTLMRQSNAPEFRKLMAYTIGRLEKARLDLTLGVTGGFEWVFDDAYRADREDVRGRWRVVKNVLYLEIPGTRPHTEKVVLTDSNRKFSTSFNEIPGLSCVFTLDNAGFR